MTDYHYGVVHAYAECKTCGKTFCNFKNAQALAKQHATKYGHDVVGELGISFGYYGASG